MRYLPGDDVVVNFVDWEAPGVVLSHVRGWVMCDVIVDPHIDYGSITSRLAPHSTVCVKESDVRYP